MKAAKIFLTINIAIQLNYVLGQTDSVRTKHKIVLSITASAANPTDTFSVYQGGNYYNSKTHITSVPKIGVMVMLTGRYAQTKNFGFLSTFSSVTCKGEVIPQETLYPASLISGNGGGTRITSYHYSTKSWYLNSLLTGIYIQTGDAHDDDISLGGRFMVGCMRARSPYCRIDETGYNWQIISSQVYPIESTIIQQPITSYSFAYNVGIDIHVHVKRKIGAFISFDFMDSDALFIRPTDANNRSVRFTERILLLCFGGGISYALK